MKCKGLISILLATLFSGCTLFKNQIDDQYKIDLIDTMIRLNYPKTTSQGKPLFIYKNFIFRDASKKIETIEECVNKAGFVDPKFPKMLEALENYCEYQVQSNVNEVSSVGEIAVNHVLVDGLVTNWDDYYAKYPASKELGYISFSMPGFSNDGSVAVIYYEWRAGDHIGSGRFERFIRKDNKWEKCVCGLSSTIWIRDK